MDPNVYVGIGILTSFVLLGTRPRAQRWEAFHELSERAETSATISAVTGEQVFGNAAGVLLDQGQQALRVGTSDVVVYTAGAERLRVLNSGPLLVGATTPAAPVNSSGTALAQFAGSIASLNQIYQTIPSSFSGYFKSPFGAYYDFGGMSIHDQSALTSYEYNGEWVQIQLPTAIKLAQYVLAPVEGLGHNGNANVPLAFHLVGSNDRVNWYYVDDRVNQTFDGTPTRSTYTVTSPAAYSTYRLIFGQVAATTGFGPVVELSNWLLFDAAGKVYPPSPMSSNTQTLGGQTYKLSTSITINNSFSYVNNKLQPTWANVVGLMASTVTLDPSNYFVMAYQTPSTPYTLQDGVWKYTGATRTVAFTSPTPFTSSLRFSSVFNASAPIECMRVYQDERGVHVGIGTTNATSALSVVGAVDTSYAAFANGVSTLARSSVSTNCVYATSALGAAALRFCSADASGSTPMNTYDAQISATGGSATPGSATLTFQAATMQHRADAISMQAASIGINQLTLTTSGVGVGTTQPVGVHLQAAPLLMAGGALSFTNTTNPEYSPLGAIQGVWSTTANQRHSGGLSFQVRPDGAAELVEALKIAPSGQMTCAQGVTVGGAQGMRMWYNAGAFMDFAQSLNVRLNTSTDPLRPAYQSILYASGTGRVGIGSVTPSAETRGGSVSYGLDLAYASPSIDVLRLINTSNVASSTARNVGMQFVLTDATANAYQKLQARIVGNSSDMTGATAGTLDFYVKCNDTNNDSVDVAMRTSVVPGGLNVGQPSQPYAFSSAVVNSLGSGRLGVAGAANDFSTDATAGDVVLRADTGHNLLLQTGTGASALCVLRNSTNVGMGSTAPKAVLDILGPAYAAANAPNGVSYLLNAVSRDISGVTAPSSGGYYAQSINFQTGDMSYTKSGQAYTSYGAKMTINGGMTLPPAGSASANVNATIDFFASGDLVNPTVRIGQRNTFNTTYTYTFMGYSTSYMSTVSQNIIGYSIWANDNIITNGGAFMAISDRRVKKNIRPMNAVDSLRRIEQLEMVQYEMRDPHQAGTQLGVIAQQALEVVPEAVKVGDSTYVANLLTPIEVRGREVRLTRVPEHEVEDGAMVRFVSESNQTVETRVEVVSPTLWRADGLDETQQWLAVGTLEHEMLSVDKDTIAMVAVSAVQQLSRQQRELRARCETLEARMSELERLMRML